MSDAVVVSGNYESESQLRNLRDDLIVAGIPEDAVKVDEDSKKISVLMPTSTAPTAIELFERHGVAPSEQPSKP